MARTPIPPVDPSPLIVTAHLDSAGFAVLDALRRRFFPLSLNRVPAHISLFHHLPGEEIAGVRAAMFAACRSRQTFDLPPERLVPLGRGVAIAYRSRELDALHAELAAKWRDWLTPQDRQPFRAHVTIQNKVAPDDARALLKRLALDAAPACRVEGLDLWLYRAGPWAFVETVRFAAPQ